MIDHQLDITTFRRARDLRLCICYTWGLAVRKPWSFSAQRWSAGVQWRPSRIRSSSLDTCMTPWGKERRGYQIVWCILAPCEKNNLPFGGLNKGAHPSESVFFFILLRPWVIDCKSFSFLPNYHHWIIVRTFMENITILSYYFRSFNWCNHSTALLPSVFEVKIDGGSAYFCGVRQHVYCISALCRAWY